MRSSGRSAQSKILGLVASGAAAAALWAGPLSQHAGAGERLDSVVSCSISDLPSLVAPVVPRSELIDGGLYVLVCEDDGGREVVNAVFVHRLAR